jgi:hypothetical protein
MKSQDLLRLRLLNQALIKNAACQHPHDVVDILGAVQAQDFLGSLWAIGQRMKKSSEARVEQAVADRSIVRTWPMRGTLHFVLPQDVRWMLKLLAPRIIRRGQSNYRNEDLDQDTFNKSKKIFEKALAGNKQLTRTKMYKALELGKIKLGGQRGLHMIGHAAMEGLICLGPREGKQHTFVLLDEWIPPRKSLTVDESLHQLALKYFIGHSPATVNDYAWWTGLTIGEAKRSIESAQSALTSVVIDKQVYWMSNETSGAKLTSPQVALLSWFDEFLVGYSDRTASFDPSASKFIKNPKNGIFSAVILMDGKVVGNWKRTFIKEKANVEIIPFRSFTPKEKKELDNVIERYKQFVKDSVGDD